jgi:hypothetical protein
MPNVRALTEIAELSAHMYLMPDILSAARIKKVLSRVPGAKPKTKFKVRCSRYIYTLSLDDPDKAEKLKQTLPPGQLSSLYAGPIFVNPQAFDLQA